MKIVALAMLVIRFSQRALASTAAVSVLAGRCRIPPGCSPMHGGVPETPSKAPVWRNGAPLSTTNGESALVVIRAVRALDSLPLE